MFAGLPPMLLKKTKKHATISERRYSVGTISGSIQALCNGGVLAPLLPHLLLMFADMFRDTEVDCRNNAEFVFGEMLVYGGPEIGQHRENILMKLSEMLKVKLNLILCLKF